VKIISNLDTCIKRIENYFAQENGKITLCIDGFVDEVWKILEKRLDRTTFSLYSKVQDFAKAVYESGSGGYSNEIIRKRRGYGGFTGNTGKAIGRLGAVPTIVGMFGKDTIDPAFHGHQEIAKLITVGNPAICQIFEFTDGKIMLPFVEETMDFNWDTLLTAQPWETLKTAFTDCDIAAMGYWAYIPAFDELVSNICESFLIDGRCKRLFFDFADIRKRDRQALDQTLELLARLNSKLPMSLSLNEHEAVLLFSYVGRNFDWKNPEKSENDICYVRKRIGLDELIVHTPYFAVASTETEGVATALQQYCDNPVITAGAGDHFNGGYIAASARQGQLSLYDRLMVGNATTSFYIRNGLSPDMKDLLGELERIGD
jgi:sugar/nucleoside kinase (ribokinase family)